MLWSESSQANRNSNRRGYDLSVSRPSYRGRKPASARASAATGSSKKTDTKPEVMLRRERWRRGVRIWKSETWADLARGSPRWKLLDRGG